VLHRLYLHANIGQRMEGPSSTKRRAEKGTFEHLLRNGRYWKIQPAFVLHTQVENERRIAASIARSGRTNSRHRFWAGWRTHRVPIVSATLGDFAVAASGQLSTIIVRVCARRSHFDDLNRKAELVVFASAKVPLNCTGIFYRSLNSYREIDTEVW
jgi:hypothetical protein